MRIITKLFNTVFTKLLNTVIQ